MNAPADPHKLARELLGRELEDLAPDEQRVVKRVTAGTVFVGDREEANQIHAGFGDRLADKVAAVGGSWGFIVGFGLVLLAWVVINSDAFAALGFAPFDRYPFIFLNLMLSMLAAVQAPIIMMSQNRQAKKDRIAARHDYEVNLRAQLELIRIAHRLDRLAREMGHVEGQAADSGKE